MAKRKIEIKTNDEVMKEVVSESVNELSNEDTEAVKVTEDVSEFPLEFELTHKILQSQLPFLPKRFRKSTLVEDLFPYAVSEEKLPKAYKKVKGALNLLDYICYVFHSVQQLVEVSDYEVDVYDLDRCKFLKINVKDDDLCAMIFCSTARYWGRKHYFKVCKKLGLKNLPVAAPHIEECFSLVQLKPRKLCLAKAYAYFRD